MFNLVSPRSFSAKLLSSQLHQHVLVPRVVPAQELPLLELHEVPVSPCLQPAEVPLNGSKTLQLMSRSSQFCVISKLADIANTVQLYTLHIFINELEK